MKWIAMPLCSVGLYAIVMAIFPATGWTSTIYACATGTIVGLAWVACQKD